MVFSLIGSAISGNFLYGSFGALRQAPIFTSASTISEMCPAAYTGVKFARAGMQIQIISGCLCAGLFGFHFIFGLFKGARTYDQYVKTRKSVRSMSRASMDMI